MNRHHSFLHLFMGIVFLFLLPSVTLAFEHYLSGTIFLTFDPAASSKMHRIPDGSILLPSGILALDLKLAKLNVEKLDPVFSFDPISLQNKEFHALRMERFYLIHFPKFFDSEQQIEKLCEELARIPGIEEAAPCPIRQLQYTPNDWQLFREANVQMVSDYYDSLRLRRAWDFGKGDSTILAVSIDTGVDYNHEDLVGSFRVNSAEDINHDGRLTSADNNGIDNDNNGFVDDVIGYDFVSHSAAEFEGSPSPGEDYGPRDNDPMDFESHGTHVAGILAARTDNGIGVNSPAFNIRTIGVRAGCEYIHLGQHLGTGSDDDFVAGIQYAVNRGARIINLSIGSYATPSSAYVTVLQYARNNNCLVFAAAGNDHSGNRLYPAAAANVIAVTSIRNDYQFSSFSNYGTWIDLSAFGQDIWSTMVVNAYHAVHYIQYHGTSMASPMAASVAALILSRNPTLTVNQLEALIMSTAINLDRYNPEEIGMMGRGLINPFADLHVIALMTPNGGERCFSGITTPIRWSTNNMSGNISIDLNRTYPNGSWEQIASSVANSGVYNWTVTGALSNNCRIRLRSVAMTPQIGDTSHANFSIISPIELNNQIIQNGYGTNYYKLTPLSAGWTAVGYRVEMSSRLHYMYGYRDSVYSERIDTSSGNYSGFPADMLVADYHHAVLSPVYYKINPDNDEYSSSYRVQGDAALDTLRPGMSSSIRNWPANNVVKIWNVFLTAGTTHTIQLDQTGGIDLGMYLFASQNSSYYSNIARNVASYQPDNFTSKQIQYTPTVSDWYGLAILCDNDSSGTYTLSIPGVRLLSPNGSESWSVGSTFPIEWNAGGIQGNITFEIDRNYPSGVWEYIGITGSNLGTYNWLVTQPASGHARIRIGISFGNQQVTDISDDDFTITQSISDLTSGNALGGNASTSYYTFNQSQNYWSVVGLHSPLGSDYDLQLFDNSAYTTTLASSSTIDSTDFIVSDHNHSRSGIFYPRVTRYSGNGTFNVQYEGGTEMLQSGSRGYSVFETSRIARVWDVYLNPGTHTFRCDRVSGSGDLGIALFASNGAAYYAGKQASVAHSDGYSDAESFSYTVTASDYYGLVVYKNTSDMAACSLFVDVPTPTIVITSPNFGGNYPYSSDVDITWNSTDVVGNVTIELARSYNSNYLWVPIAENIANSGYYRWTATGPETGQARVRIRTLNMTPMRSDTCDANFSISFPSIGSLIDDHSVPRQGGDVVFYSYTQSSPRWSATGIRSTSGVDYDLSLWTDNNFTNEAANSGLTNPVDFIAVDYNHTPTGQYYNRMNRYGGTGSFSIEWCAGSSTPLAPPCAASGSWLSDDVVKMWDVNLIAGIPYTFTVERTSGSAAFGIKLFQSHDAPYFAGCGQSVSAVELTSSNTASFVFTPLSDDDYGLALYANNESPSNFTITVDEPSRFVINSPGSMDSWDGNSTRVINWNSIHINGNINIELNRHYPWGDWTTIASNISNTNSFNWLVTGPSTQNGRIRISSVSMTPQICDTSISDFSIVAPPSLSFTSPPANTTCNIGTMRSIGWSAQNIEGNLAILFNRNSYFGTWDTILSNVANTGAVDWLVTGPETTHGLFKITTLSMWPAVVAYSDTPLVVVQPHTISVTAPNGGERWTLGSSRSIQWSFQSITGNVAIELNRNYPNGSWETIAANTSNSGSYLWTVAGAVTNNSSIRVRSLAMTPEVSGFSSNIFTIMTPPTMQLLSPVGGETWNAGFSHNLTWATSNTSVYQIFLTTDNGTSWTMINSGLAVSPYPWTVPSLASTRCRIKIVNEDGSIADSSHAMFTITSNPQLQVLSPNGGELLYSNQNRFITWTAVNGASVYRLEYSTNSGTSWIRIDSSSAGLIQPYIWSIPATATTGGLIRISNQSRTYSDVSDAAFSIIIPSISLTSPNGGEYYAPNQLVNIRFVPRIPDSVKVEVSFNNGFIWSQLGIAPYLDTCLNWLVPNNASDSCLIRVSSVNNPTIFDVSNQMFSIVTTGIRVLSPNGGESWQAGSTQAIRFFTTVGDTATGTDMFYSTNNGVSWIALCQIRNQPPGNVTYNHTVPNVGTTNALYKAVVSNNATLYDVSDRIFTILPLTAIISTSPRPLDFADGHVGSGKLSNLYIRNSGTDTLRITGIDLPTTVSTTWSTRNIAPGDSIVNILTWVATTLGTWHDTLYVRSNATNSSRYAVPLSGYGRGAVVSSPDTVMSFGSVHVDSTRTITIHLVNSGNDSLFYSLTSSPPDVGFATSSFAVAGGTTGTFTLAWTPHWNNPINDSVVVTTNAINRSRMVIRLTGTARGQMCMPGVSNIAFDTVETGGSQVRSLYLRNPGTDTLHITNTSIARSPATITTNWTTRTILPGDSAQLSLTWHPVTSGNLSDSLIVVSDAFNIKRWAVTINGVAIGHPEITVRSTSIGLGAVAVGSSGSQTIYIRSTGYLPLTITNITAPANVTKSWTSRTIAVNDSSALLITWTPLSTGTLSDSLRITSNASRHPILSIPLTGSAYIIPGIPANLSILFDRNTSIATLNWLTASGTVSGYNVYRYGNNGYFTPPGIGTLIGSVLSPSTVYQDSTAGIGMQYYYRVNSFYSPVGSTDSK